MTEEEHLNQLRHRVHEASQKTRELTRDLSSDQLLWKPDPKKWSIAGCFEHLILAGEQWHPNIRSAIQESDPARDSASREFKRTLFGRFFLGTSGEKVRFPIPTAPVFEPTEEIKADAPERFLNQQEELIQLIDDSHGLDLRSAGAAFPQWSRISLRLGEALTLVVNHQHRHLSQAEAVTQEDGFPSSDN